MPAQVAKQVKAKNITGEANVKTLFTYGYANGKRYTALKKTVKKYDVTGDKKPDKITFKLKASKWGNSYTDSLAISINGKKTKLKIDGKTVSKITDNAGGLASTIQLITMKNGRPFLYVRYLGDNGDGTFALLRYKGGKLVSVASDNDIPKKFTSSHRFLLSVKPSGNKISITYQPMTLFAGVINLKYTYTVTSKGTLKKVKKGDAYTKYDYTTKAVWRAPLTASATFTAYTSTSMKEKAFTIYAQDQVDILKSYFTSDKLLFKVRNAWGETGWVAAPTKSGPHWGTYFEETGLAG